MCKQCFKLLNTICTIQYNTNHNIKRKSSPIKKVIDFTEIRQKYIATGKNK